MKGSKKSRCGGCDCVEKDGKWGKRVCLQGRPVCYESCIGLEAIPIVYSSSSENHTLAQSYGPMANLMTCRRRS
jgi:hypothetical protein